MTLRRTLLVFLLLFSLGSFADECKQSIARLASGGSPDSEGSRSDVIQQLSELYGNALNGRAPMEAVTQKIQELAEVEGVPWSHLFQEVQSQAALAADRIGNGDQRQEQRRMESAHVWEGLEPYLDHLTRKDRAVIESTLLRPLLLKPVVAREVEFRFEGPHSFWMGNEYFHQSGRDALPLVLKEFDRGDSFTIGQVPVTQLLYLLSTLYLDGANPSPSEFQSGEGAVVMRLNGKEFSIKPNHPVEKVNWHEARVYAEKVSALTGRTYSLPSEPEYEFAVRAGSKTRYHFGDTDESFHQYDWARPHSGSTTHPVAELRPNAFQIFDAHGNVRTWTEGVFINNEAIVRGGSWFEGRSFARAGSRIHLHSNARLSHFGFRLVSRGSPASSGSTVFVFGNQEPAKESSLDSDRARK
jgi:formylglycine-generating enzyme required for sulfatase activity